VKSLITGSGGYAYFTGANNITRYCMIERVAPAGYEPFEGRRYFSYEETETIEMLVPNKRVSTAGDVQKQTIDITSAGFMSLPGEAGIDNTGQGRKELYRYDVDYRSRATSWADELVLDDPLEAVAAGQIHVEELWTPISYGDHDGRFNIWYRTNLTDDTQIYSAVKAADNDPDNPNNAARLQRFPNTGWKLWERDVGVRERKHLKVADLTLASDEYVTALRIEHGRVEKGFTTRNTGDWRPQSSQGFYTIESASASGLEPLSYLVSCPLQLSNEETETVIVNSASAHITRDIILSDDATDTVETRVIESFTLEPTESDHPDIDFENEGNDILYRQVFRPHNNPDPGMKPRSQRLPGTGDAINLALWLALLGAASLFIWWIIKSARRERLIE
jgi:hypothetical protein